MSAQADDTPTAISNVLQVLRASFRTREARRLSEIYAEDADWTNALGTNLKGSEQIVDYLTGLFADSHFGAGQAGTPQVSIRLVTPDVFHSSLSPLHCCKGALFRRQSPKYHVSQCNDLAAKRRGDTRMKNQRALDFARPNGNNVDPQDGQKWRSMSVSIQLFV